MDAKPQLNIFWFRRDLRLNDNTGLFHALKSGLPVLPIFIFDTILLKELERDDPRVSFIHDQLEILNKKFQEYQSRLMVRIGEPFKVIESLAAEYSIANVFANRDYEPYAISRDAAIRNFLLKQGIPFSTFKDQVIFEKDEVSKEDGRPYTVYTPYMNKWIARFREMPVQRCETSTLLSNLFRVIPEDIPSLKEIGFIKSTVKVAAIRISDEFFLDYEQNRNFPFIGGTSCAGPHLRFGTYSIRELVKKADMSENKTYLKELVWREFFMQILFHFPGVVSKSFKPAYDNITWINDEHHFTRWSQGTTGYPLVDAGMRELNATGRMHNRVRMVTASFLCKHLLIDWRWGETYFAKKLLDFELSSNNGNWQWAAGTGCDAAPYFRIFNPTEQMKKFDPEMRYVKKWLPEFGSEKYPKPLIDHHFARQRALEVYRQALR